MDQGLIQILAVSVFIVLVGRSNFLLAHMLVEGWSVLVAFLMFVLVVQTRRYVEDGFLLFIGVAYAAVAVLDSVHALCYPGMGVIPRADSLPSVRLWGAARLVQALSLLLAPWLSRRYRLRMAPLIAVFGTVVVLALSMVFAPDVFPRRFMQGQGLIRFGIGGESLVSVLLFCAAIVVYRERRRLGPELAQPLIASILCTIGAELPLAIRGYCAGGWPILGHVLKAVSFYILYRALVVRGLHEPFKLKEIAEVSLRRNREKLRQSLVLLHEALEATADGLLIADLDWNMLVCNGRFRRLWRIEEHAYEGVPLRVHVDTFLKTLKTPVRFEQRLRQLEMEPGAAAFDVLTLRDGRIMECFSSPFRVRGRISGRLWSFRDCTRRRRVEQERNRMRDGLAHATRVSTMGYFAASLAHEINQPLAAIMVNAEAGCRLLEDDRPDLGEIRDLLQDIVDDDRRAAEVLRRLRDFLRRKAPERKPVDISQATREVCHMFHTALERRRIELKLDLKSVPKVAGDRVQLQQVVLNLLTNAMEAVESQNDDRQIRRVEIVSFSPDPDHVQVTVRDSGSGLRGDPRTAFDPFHSTKPNGLGMGLAVSRTIIEAHGGRIWFSAPGISGAECHFVLPTAHLQPS